MNLSELDYVLPPEQIAQWPLEDRDASRMLLLDRSSGRWEDRQFRDFPDLLHGNELMVLNNARVLPARLFGRREGLHAAPLGAQNSERREHLQAQFEVLLVRRLSGDTWEVLVRPGRKIPTGEKIIFGKGELEAQVEGRGNFGLRILRFSAKDGLAKALASLGHVPLPPYIKRADSPLDRERYQTVFARQGFAAAAPTAGLHFTPQILERAKARGGEIAEITLEIGLGTFEPVRTERLEDYNIHSEAYEIPPPASEAIARAQREKRPILAVGTTVVRALEDAAEKCNAQHGRVQPGKAEATILLLPGKPFRIVNQMLTNFHLPRSSLLAMVAAFAGRKHILGAYRHAVETGYRFYSYGDCMLIR